MTPITDARLAELESCAEHFRERIVAASALIRDRLESGLRRSDTEIARRRGLGQTREEPAEPSATRQRFDRAVAAVGPLEEAREPIAVVAEFGRAVRAWFGDIEGRRLLRIAQDETERAKHARATLIGELEREMALGALE